MRKITFSLGLACVLSTLTFSPVQAEAIVPFLDPMPQKSAQNESLLSSCLTSWKHYYDQAFELVTTTFKYTATLADTDNPYTEDLAKKSETATPDSPSSTTKDPEVQSTPTEQAQTSEQEALKAQPKEDKAQEDKEIDTTFFDRLDMVLN